MVAAIRPSRPPGGKLSSTPQASGSTTPFTPMVSTSKYPPAKPEFTSFVHRNGVAWDTALGREVLPMSSQDFEAVGDAEEPRSTHNCICGAKIRVRSSDPLALAGARLTPSQRDLARQPRPVFDEDVGAFNVPKMPALSTGFARLDVSAATNQPDARKTKAAILAPVGFTVEQYLAADYKSPALSYERTVPACPHYPITEELLEVNIVFKKGSRWARDQFGRDVDQARYLCLIADDRRTNKRRMTIHAPPADWTDIEQVSTLNRWKGQFRHRKLGLLTREYREPWTEEQLQFILDYLVEHDAVYQRDDLAELVNEQFGIDRNAHSVTCAIDNHKLRDKANEEIERRKEEKRQEKSRERVQEMLADYGLAGFHDSDSEA